MQVTLNVTDRLADAITVAQSTLLSGCGSFNRYRYEQSLRELSNYVSTETKGYLPFCAMTVRYTNKTKTNMDRTKVR